MTRPLGGVGLRRGGVYWGDPTYPDGSGGPGTDHRCLVLRTPSRADTIVPILTLHSIKQRLRTLNDCMFVFEVGAYGLTKPTYIDARMTMFAHVHSLGGFAFDLSGDDLDEIDFCLLNALQLPFDDIT